ncbi:hypothetical protein AX14_004090 [Amanita brunnescens Koide BX004]|nr:hypothetical protein AX14_004090 [Amanita brunnescens Koide BX004]
MRVSNFLYQRLLYFPKSVSTILSTVATCSNRFEKDSEGNDSALPDRSSMHLLLALAAIVTMRATDGPFSSYLGRSDSWNVGKGKAIYIQSSASRSPRRSTAQHLGICEELDFVYRSPLYSISGETISGAAVHAFGPSSTIVLINNFPTDRTLVNVIGFNRFNPLSAGLVGAVPSLKNYAHRKLAFCWGDRTSRTWYLIFAGSAGRTSRNKLHQPWLKGRPSWPDRLWLFRFIYAGESTAYLVLALIRLLTETRGSNDTLPSTFDVFERVRRCGNCSLVIVAWWQFEALRRVHLLPSGDKPADPPETLNINVSATLLSNGVRKLFDRGETKQLLCMTRAILKQPKVLVMDEVNHYFCHEMSF